MRLPNLKILQDDSYGTWYPHALRSVRTFWTDVDDQNELYLEFGFPVGHRLVLQTNCPIINEPDVSEGGEMREYDWVIDKSIYGVYDPVIRENRYEGMLEVLTFQNGTIIRRLLKEGYAFAAECRDDHPDCAYYTYDPEKYMVLPSFSVDFYYGYFDITDLIPQTGTSQIVICPKVNFRGRWAEQNLNDNDVQIPITLTPSDPYASIDFTALSQLIPQAPSDIRVAVWHGNHLALVWTGSAEWYEVDHNGAIVRVSAAKYDDFKATGKSGVYKIRAGNRYKISDWVTYTATRK